MKVIYDIEVDILRILFNDSPVEESDEEREGIIFDYDKQGKLVGMEILDASQQINEPHAMEMKYAVTHFHSTKMPLLADVGNQQA
jgi:YD repeat-containing protein